MATLQTQMIMERLWSTLVHRAAHLLMSMLLLMLEIGASLFRVVQGFANWLALWAFMLVLTSFVGLGV